MDDRVRERELKESQADEQIKEDLLGYARADWDKGWAQEEAGDFKEAAMSYRLSAALYRTVIEDFRRQRDRARTTIGVYRHWAERHVAKVEPVWQRKGPESWDTLRDLMYNRLLLEEAMAPFILCIDERLHAHGAVICTGHTLSRRIISLLVTAFNGEEEGEYAFYLKDVDMRVALETIAERVLEIRQEPGYGSPEMDEASGDAE